MSLAGKYLTKDIQDLLQERVTRAGVTLDKILQSGRINTDSDIGLYAGDAQSYDVFAPLFDPIIRDYHGIGTKTRHVSDLRTVRLINLDPERRHILSSRVRVARNIKGYSFTSHLSLQQRKSLEKSIVKALKMLSGKFQGEYFPMERSCNRQDGKLQGKGPAFAMGDRFQEAAGINADFPEGRGVFLSSDERFRVWVNEEDHMRIMSQETTADLAVVFNRLARALQELEILVDFEHNPSYGYLTSCPSNIGTAMRASVHIQLPRLLGQMPILDALATEHNLQIRGTRGEKTEVDGAVFDISNERRFGISEKKIITDLHSGIRAIMDTEKRL